MKINKGYSQREKALMVIDDIKYIRKLEKQHKGYKRSNLDIIFDAISNYKMGVEFEVFNQRKNDDNSTEIHL